MQEDYCVPGSWTDCSGQHCVQTRYPEPNLEWPSPTKRRARGESQNTTNKHNVYSYVNDIISVPLLLYKKIFLNLFYLGNFNAPVLFLGLVCGSIVVPGTVIIDQLPVPLSNTCLNKKRSMCYSVSPSSRKNSVFIFQT